MEPIITFLLSAMEMARSHSSRASPRELSCSTVEANGAKLQAIIPAAQCRRAVRVCRSEYGFVPIVHRRRRRYRAAYRALCFPGGPIVAAPR